MTALSRETLDSQLDALAGQLPHLVASVPDPADFWPAFVGAADAIEDQAGDHSAYVRERIATMLEQAGVPDPAKAS